MAPVRDKTHPWGFPWLEGERLRLARLGNILVERCIEVFNLLEGTMCITLLEFPEDMGRAQLGDPASIWQLSDLLDALRRAGADQTAVHQCIWEVDFGKPTRLAGKLKGLKSRPPLQHQKCVFRGEYAYFVGGGWDSRPPPQRFRSDILGLHVSLLVIATAGHFRRVVGIATRLGWTSSLWKTLQTLQHDHLACVVSLPI